jgi:2OG-Fe(II) oxygenase superfamily
VKLGVRRSPACPPLSRDRRPGIPGFRPGRLGTGLPVVYRGRATLYAQIVSLSESVYTRAVGVTASKLEGRSGLFDRNKLRELAETHADEYKRARPFPHAVFDDFAPAEALEAVLDEFPELAGEGKELERGKTWLSDESLFGPRSREVIHELNSSTFIEFLELLTGIDGLVPDPHLVGGGLHQTVRGGFLKVHADFNWHERLLLDRRINLILYLNRDWKEEYGGHLELWNGDMTRCEQRIHPVFNRCVIFNTTDFSYHGHPDPLTCPDGMTRKSIAMYYYSNGRPAEEVSEAHTTLFKARPGEVMRRSSEARVGTLGKRLLPPIVLDGVRAAKSKLRR